MRSLTENSTAIPNFVSFEPTKELWNDYLSRFLTFVEANSIPTTKIPQVFLTIPCSLQTLSDSCSSTVLDMIPCDVNKLDFAEIQEVMFQNFSPKRFVVRERFCCGCTELSMLM